MPQDSKAADETRMKPFISNESLPNIHKLSCKILMDYLNTIRSSYIIYTDTKLYLPVKLQVSAMRKVLYDINVNRAVSSCGNCPIRVNFVSYFVHVKGNKKYKFFFEVFINYL